MLFRSAGKVDYRRAEIDADPSGRPGHRQQVADAATDLQYALVRGNQKRVMPLQQLMIAAFAFAKAQSGAAIVEGTAVGHWLWVLTPKLDEWPETLQ